MRPRMWTPVTQHGRLSERIVAQVERLISGEQLRPGDRLPPEREMAELLGVSRPSLREAVRILQAQGRLVVKHGRGVFIQSPRSERELRAALGVTDVSLRDLYVMREVLEVPAAGWAAEKISQRQLRQIRKSLDELRGASTRAPLDYEQLRRLDATFHLSVAVAAGNRFLSQTTNVLNEMLLSGMQTTLLIPGRIERSRSDHERLFAALERHDVSGARQAARLHIRGVYAAAEKHLFADGGIVAAPIA